MVNKKSLYLVVLPGKNPPQYLAHHYNIAYDCWKQTWEAASHELQEMPHSLDSTEFIRQDEVLAVFDGDNCTSLGFWTELDFRFKASAQDFYFRKWTGRALNALTRDGYMVGKYSYLTVAKDYRKYASRDGFSFKDLQIGIFTKRFIDSSTVAMTGTTRNNKSVNQVCSRGGAMLIESSLEQYGVNIDLMVWYRDTAKPHDSVATVVDFLWQERTDFKNKQKNIIDNSKEGVLYGSPASA